MNGNYFRDQFLRIYLEIQTSGHKVMKPNLELKSERIDSIVYKILQKGKENQILIFLKRRELIVEFMGSLPNCDLTHECVCLTSDQIRVNIIMWQNFTQMLYKDCGQRY